MDSDSSVSVATPRGLVTITAPRLASRRLRTRQEAHRDFLASHWAELSAAAYEGYRRHGAGAVVLWRSERPRRFRPRPFEPERLFYTTQIHALPGTTEADFDDLKFHTFLLKMNESHSSQCFEGSGSPIGSISTDPSDVFPDLFY